jgi:hypothetical protein
MTEIILSALWSVCPLALLYTTEGSISIVNAEDNLSIPFRKIWFLALVCTTESRIDTHQRILPLLWNVRLLELILALVCTANGRVDTQQGI